MFKAGDLVRHTVKTEWGLGRVVGQTTEGKVLIKFAGKQGDVLLTAAFAQTHLVADAGGDWQELRRSHRPEQAVLRVPCGNCSTGLREPLTAADGQWRSCPECSARNGRQHVFLPFPEAFDILEPPAESACRRRRRPPGPLVPRVPFWQHPRPDAHPDLPRRAALTGGTRPRYVVPLQG